MNEMGSTQQQGAAGSDLRPEDVTVLVVDDELDIAMYLSGRRWRRWRSTSPT